MELCTRWGEVKTYSGCMPGMFTREPQEWTNKNMWWVLMSAVRMAFITRATCTVIVPMLRDGWCYNDCTAGSTATQMNHHLSCHLHEPLEPVAVCEAIDRLSIFTFHRRKHTRAKPERINQRPGRTPGPGSRSRPGPQRVGRRKGRVVHYRGGEGTYGALRGGERNPL